MRPFQCASQHIVLYRKRTELTLCFILWQFDVEGILWYAIMFVLKLRIFLSVYIEGQCSAIQLLVEYGNNYIELFSHCKGGNFNIHIWAWFGYFI